MATALNPLWDDRITHVLPSPPLTDAEFEALLERYDPLHVEYDADEGEVILIRGTDIYIGESNGDIITDLAIWARKDGRGVVTDSSTSFTLPNGSRREPDAAWTDRRRIPSRKQTRRPVLAPDFVIELRSESNRPSLLRRKMQDYVNNGVKLAWLIDPFENRVTVYRPGREPEVLDKPASVAGEGPVEGFVLDLTRIWES
ncbi:MAG: Uma2 family endonuclease [Bryobacteraceae bacterium]|nr:Uma2 family endonuclease [Bryobacteraceae bacterium]